MPGTKKQPSSLRASVCGFYLLFVVGGIILLRSLAFLLPNRYIIYIVKELTKPVFQIYPS